MENLHVDFCFGSKKFSYDANLPRDFCFLEISYFQGMPLKINFDFEKLNPISFPPWSTLSVHSKLIILI